MGRMGQKALAFSAALVLAACVQTAQSASAQDAPLPQGLADHPSCEAHPAISLTPGIARQGARLKLTVEEPVGAYAPREIPPALVTGWTASPAGQVTFAPEASSLTVANNATPGANVTLSANFCGRPLTRTIRIVGKDEPVLTGIWRQESISCAGETPADPVRELDIRDNGSFSITYAPFESYRDFWGSAEVNIATGALAFTVTGGNRAPSSARLAGKASLTPEGKLILDGFFLSQPQAAGGQCRYVFAK